MEALLLDKLDGIRFALNTISIQLMCLVVVQIVRTFKGK